MARKLAIANQKGGVRKTTTTGTLAYVLGEELKGRTLVIDIDPQKNLTKKFLPNYTTLPLSTTIYSTFHDNSPLPITATRFDNIDISPAHISLAKVETEIASEMDARFRLRNAIAAIEHKYENIIIDCPPSLGLLSINGLAAADKVLVPISHLGDEIEGLTDLIDTIKKVKKYLNPDLEIAGLLLTMVDSTLLFRAFKDKLQKEYGNLVFESEIPRSILIPEATNRNQLIFEYDESKTRKQPIENSYRDLAKEIINTFNK